MVPTISIGDYKVGGSEADGTAGGIEYEVPAADATDLIIDQGKYWADNFSTLYIIFV